MRLQPGAASDHMIQSGAMVLPILVIRCRHGTASASTEAVQLQYLQPERCAQTVETYQQFINGALVDSHSTERIDVENPYTNEVIARAPRGDE